jgi:hypothetical protein
MTSEQVRNRGYNLLVTTVLFTAGLGLGSSAIPEGDLADKVDDLGLLVIGLVAAGWYLFGGARLRRTPVPLVLTVLALVAQLAGVFLEAGDKESFGDNIGGMLMLVPFTGIALWQYLRPIGLSERPSPAPEPAGRTV